MGAALPLPTTVPPSGSRAFTLTLNADTGGSLGGTASLLSNDAENSPFTLALSGIVTADLPPTVRITAPQEGTSVVVGSPVPLYDKRFCSIGTLMFTISRHLVCQADASVIQQYLTYEVLWTAEEGRGRGE